MSALESQTLQTLQDWLAEALASRQRIMTGPTSFASSDRRIAYEHKLSDLNRYINQLQAAIAAKQATASGCRPGGPIVIGF